MKYLIVRSDAALVDEGSAADAVLLKGTFIEVNDIVTHFIVMCYANLTVFSIKCMTYGEGLGKLSHYFCRLGVCERLYGHR